ncbi:MAG: winged helix-turn-helix domain-containing protein [Acidimicrobiales bacterium]
MQVELVYWPAEADRRRELSEGAQPRILLVGEGEPAPITVDPLEDWIRLPADERDLQVRVETLTRRLDVEPVLDDDGVLHHRHNWTALPPIEARLTQTLLARFGKVVSREALLRQGWPDEEPKRNVLDVHVLRLRRRLEPLGLTIRTVRKRGYVLGR